MPDGTVGFRIDGDVEREDYTEILVPALKAAVDSGSGLRALYLIEDLDDIEGGALWEDTKLGFDLAIEHHSDWRRSAIVTDIDWMARASKLFLWLFPGEARLFRVADLEQAKRGSPAWTLQLDRLAVSEDMDAGARRERATRSAKATAGRSIRSGRCGRPMGHHVPQCTGQH